MTIPIERTLCWDRLRQEFPRTAVRLERQLPSGSDGFLFGRIVADRGAVWFMYPGPREILQLGTLSSFPPRSGFFLEDEVDTRAEALRLGRPKPT